MTRRRNRDDDTVATEEVVVEETVVEEEVAVAEEEESVEDDEDDEDDAGAKKKAAAQKKRAELLNPDNLKPEAAKHLVLGEDAKTALEVAAVAMDLLGLKGSAKRLWQDAERAYAAAEREAIRIQRAGGKEEREAGKKKKKQDKIAELRERLEKLMAEETETLQSSSGASVGGGTPAPTRQPKLSYRRPKMNTATDTEYSVGQKMILVRDRHDPIVVNIDRLTKTLILVRHPNAQDDPKRALRFEKSSWIGSMGQSSPLQKHSTAGGRDAQRYSKAHLYDYTDEAMTELKRCRIDSIRRQEEKTQAEQKRQQEIENRHAQELAEVKEVCHDGQLALLMKLSTRQPDGTRVYVLDVPVSAQHFERKKGWETVMVTCTDVEEVDWEKWSKWRSAHKDEEITEETTEAGKRACSVHQVEFYHTWTNGGSSSFASCSRDKAANDNEALWEVVRSVYFSW